MDERIISMARIAMRFGRVQRATLHEDGEPESDTTHTVMLALVAMDVEATQRLTNELGGDSQAMGLLRRYEAQQEPEARLVRCLDKMLPQLTHLLNKGIALQAVGLTADALREKHAAQGASLASQYPEMLEARRLLAEACDLVRCGIISGDIRAAQGGTTG